jgi:peptidoglycan/xylan/chitin deacetylase (PgdA/CDA1 family)
MLKNRIVNIVFFLVLLIAILSDVFGEVSVWFYAGIIFVYSVIQGVGATILSAQFFVPVKFRGDPSQNSIALTFDDGPVPGKTERILDILQTRQIRAAFFCIGRKINEHPQLIMRIHNEGHMIGNHSYWHGKTFDLQTPETIGKELHDTSTAIHRNLGQTPRLFRPPYGVTNPMVASAIRKGSYTTIGWSLRSFDTMISDPSRLLNKVKRSLKAGDIILFHDHCESTIEILPALLDHVAGIGLKIVRVDELLNEKAYV